MPKTVRIILALAAISGFISVALGAFGAHGLKGKINESLFNAYQTGVQYQLYHTFILFVVALLLLKGLHFSLLNTAAVLFALGMVFFSGSLYWLAMGGPGWLGPVTPIGGLLLLCGWIVLCIAVCLSQ